MTKFVSYLSVIVLLGCGTSTTQRSVTQYPSKPNHCGIYSAKTKEEAEDFCNSKNQQVIIDTVKNARGICEIYEDEVRFNCSNINSNTGVQKIKIDKLVDQLKF
jgi:hypothetical protein